MEIARKFVLSSESACSGHFEPNDTGAGPPWLVVFREPRYYIIPTQGLKEMARTLEVKSGLDTTPQFIVDNDGVESSLAISTGKIGIGTASPVHPLEVAGDVSVGIKNVGPRQGHGPKLFFAGVVENNNVQWIERFNEGDDTATLRVNISDAEDKTSSDESTVPAGQLQVGYTDVNGGKFEWKTQFSVSSVGDAYVHNDLMVDGGLTVKGGLSVTGPLTLPGDNLTISNLVNPPDVTNLATLVVDKSTKRVYMIG